MCFIDRSHLRYIIFPCTSFTPIIIWEDSYICSAPKKVYICSTHWYTIANLLNIANCRQSSSCADLSPVIATLENCTILDSCASMLISRLHNNLYSMLTCSVMINEWIWLHLLQYSAIFPVPQETFEEHCSFSYSSKTFWGTCSPTFSPKSPAFEFSVVENWV